MEENIVEGIYRLYNRKINTITTGFIRYLFYQINWNDRLIGIKGARRVGKTRTAFSVNYRNQELPQVRVIALITRTCLK